MKPVHDWEIEWSTLLFREVGVIGRPAPTPRETAAYAAALAIGDEARVGEAIREYVGRVRVSPALDPSRILGHARCRCALPAPATYPNDAEQTTTTSTTTS